MTWKQCAALTLFAALAAGTAAAYVQRGSVFQALDKRPVPELQVIEYYSEVIDQTYRLYVQLPPGYDESKSRYPVMYVTDGDAAVGMYDEVVLPLIRQRRIPEIIVVGIGYKDVPPVSIFKQNTDKERESSGALDAAQVRMRDYTAAIPEHAPNAGGAPDFLRFVTHKIVPFIDAAYHTDRDDRGIAGHSLGGLFSFYAQLTAPEVFNRCVSTSPSLFWADRDVFDREAAFAKAHSEWDTSLYVGAGSDESPILSGAMQDMVDTLTNRRYGKLSMRHEWHRGENHMSVIEPAITAGLEFVY